MIGLTAGQFIHIRRDSVPSARSMPPAIGAAHATPVLRSVNLQSTVDEEQFLSDVDLAASAPQAAELRAIYAFTIEPPRDIAPARGRKN